MTITSNGFYGTVDPGAGFLNVSEGEVTVTGDNGGFDVIFGQYMLPGDDFFVTPVSVGTTIYNFQDNRVNGPATLTLVGGGDGVGIFVEDNYAPGFDGAIRVGAFGGVDENSNSGEFVTPTGTINITNGASLTSTNNGVYDPDVQYVRGGAANIQIGNDNGNGTVNVTGATSVLGAYGVDPRITVGANDGVGVLNIADGGEVRTNSVEVGRNSGGDGLVTVDGQGSRLVLSSNYGLNDRFNGQDFSGFGPSVRVGRDGGTGVIEVTNGGEFLISNVDGLTDNLSLQLGRGVDGTGSLDVRGEGSVVNIRQIGPPDDAPYGAFFSIGRGGAGTVDVADGGIINVTGNDAFVEVSGDDTDGSVSGRTSYLNVRDGGVLNIDSETYEGGGLHIGRNVGTSGVVTVDGAGSEINITSDGDSFGAFFVVGREGDGALNVTDGGKIVIDGGTDQFPVFYVGEANNNATENVNSGYALISGAGSSVTVLSNNDEFGGFAAVGRRDFSDGTLVINDNGQLVVDGAGGSLEIASLNGDETGVFQNKGLVRVGDGGGITVEDAIAVSGDIRGDSSIVFEYGGDGRLYVDIGGQVTASRVAVGDQGLLQIDGGTVNGDVTVTGELRIARNDETSGYTTGFASINGSLTQNGGALVLDINNETVNGEDTLNHDMLGVDGDVTLDGAAIDVIGTNLASAAESGALEVGDVFDFITATGAITATNLDQFDLTVEGVTGFGLTLLVDDREGGDALVARVDSLGDAPTPGEEPSDDPDVITLPEEGGEVDAGGGDDSVTGGDGDDTVDGGAGDDVIDGGGGADSIEGGDGADALSGGAGNDALSGGGGGDMLDGGTGSDALSGGRGSDTLNGGGGRDSLDGGGGRDMLSGGGGRDMLSGGGGRDMLSGGGGRDNLDGGGGRDNVDGGGGRDVVTGGGGRDMVNGGGGRDMVSGGRGRDELTGGAGRDTFVFSTGDGRDTITDFRQNQDRIQIDSGANGFDDLIISQFGDDVLIRFANVRITVEDDLADNFTAADFIF